VQLLLATNERCHRGGVERLGAAAERAAPQHLPRQHRTDAPNNEPAEVAISEQIPDHPPRILGDDDLSRLAKILQSRCLPRGLAQHLAIRVGDDEAAGHADPDR
jgi:hypothetical protein